MRIDNGRYLFLLFFAAFGYVKVPPTIVDVPAVLLWHGEILKHHTPFIDVTARRQFVLFVFRRRGCYGPESARAPR